MCGVSDGALPSTESGRAPMSASSAACYAFSPHVADMERSRPALRLAGAAPAAPMPRAPPVAGAAEPGSGHEVAAYGARPPRHRKGAAAALPPCPCGSFVDTGRCFGASCSQRATVRAVLAVMRRDRRWDGLGPRSA